MLEVNLTDFGRERYCKPDSNIEISLERKELVFRGRHVDEALLRVDRFNIVIP